MSNRLSSPGFWLRLTPLIVLIAAGVIAWQAGLLDQIRPSALQEEHAGLLDWVDENLFLAVIAFILIHAIVASTLPPGAVIMVTLAGFLFGWAGGTAVALAGAFLGTLPTYFAARTAFGDMLARRGGETVEKIRTALSENAFTTILAFRLFPIVPYFFLNLAAGLARVDFRKYVAATIIGLIPPQVAFAGLGAGASEAIEAGEPLDTSLLAQPEIMVPLLVIGAIAICVLAYRLRSAYVSRHDTSEQNTAG